MQVKGILVEGEDRKQFLLGMGPRATGKQKKQPTICHHLVAWFKRLVLPPAYHRTTLKILRHHLLNLAAKIVHIARRCFLIISNGYRYQAVCQFAMKRLAALQFP